MERENDTVWDFYVEVLEGLWLDGQASKVSCLVEAEF